MTKSRLAAGFLSLQKLKLIYLGGDLYENSHEMK